MKVFIFGAGASKASQVDFIKISERSPLMDELFNDVYQVYAEMVGLTNSELNYCREGVGSVGSVEKWLTDRWEKVSTYKTVRTQDTERNFFGRAALYIWLSLLKISETYNEKNLYHTFLRKLKMADEEYGLINFNYDLLLDRAIQDVCGYTLNSRQSYIVKAKYIKPHGSVNWLVPKRISDPGVQIEYNMETRVRLDIMSENMFRDETLSLNGLQIIEPNHRDLREIDHMIRRFQDQYFYPIILMPLTTKQYDRIKDFQETVIESGKELLSKTDEIYLIGYRARDDIVKELFSNVKPGTKLNIVSNNKAESIAEAVLEWKPNLKKGSTLNIGFEKFVEDYR